jgi:predicted amidophosphoribosyltransferase
MPLTKCPSCQSDVSTKADACPECGHRFKPSGGISLKDPIHVVGLIIVVGFIIVMFFIGLENWRR